MLSLHGWYPGGRYLELLLVATLGVTFVSSAAWILARRLERDAALRHVVLVSALVVCLAHPLLVWLCDAGGWTLVSVPVLGGAPERATPDDKQAEIVPEDVLPGHSSGLVHSDATLPSPSNSTFERPPRIANPIAADARDGTAAPSRSGVSRAHRPASGSWSLRGVAASALLLWVAGALVMVARLVRNAGFVVQLRRSSRPLENGRIEILLQEAADRLGMRQVPLLLTTSRAIAPVAVGFGRSAIILPDRLLKAIDNDELRDILIHEAAHLQHENATSGCRSRSRDSPSRRGPMPTVASRCLGSGATASLNWKFRRQASPTPQSQ